MGILNSKVSRDSVVPEFEFTMRYSESEKYLSCVIWGREWNDSGAIVNWLEKQCASNRFSLNKAADGGNIKEHLPDAQFTITQNYTKGIGSSARTYEALELLKIINTCRKHRAEIKELVGCMSDHYVDPLSISMDGDDIKIETSNNVLEVQDMQISFKKIGLANFIVTSVIELDAQNHKITGSEASNEYGR